NGALAVLMLGVALITYFHPTDWGRKEPHKVYTDLPKGKDAGLPNLNKPSQLDLQMAALQEAVNARPRAEARLERALRNRDSLQQIFAQNHLEYLEKVEKLERAGRRGWSRRDDIEIRELKYDGKDGMLVLNSPGMTVLDGAGKPELDK